VSMPKKVLVTGAGGFIGGHVVKYFLNQSLQIVALFHKEQAEKESQIQKRNIQKSELLSRLPSATAENFTIVDGDITIKADVDAVFHDHQPDAIIHTAALLIAPKETDELACKRFSEINEASALADSIAEYQKINNTFYCMLISTIFVLDTTAEDIDENTPYKPTGLYAKSKATAELNWRLKIANLIVLRPPQVYGPYQFTPAIMPRIIRKLLLDEDIIRSLNGEMNPIHIKNFIKIIHALCISSEVGCYCVNGDGVMSLAAIALQLQNAATDFLATQGKKPFSAFTISDSAASKALKINDLRLMQFFNLKFPDSNPHELISFENTATEMTMAMAGHVAHNH